MFRKENVHKIILTAIGLVVLILGVLLFIYPPAVFPDPGMGFQVMRSMQMGGGFNLFTSPDQSDISQNFSEFLTWWSPGQYLVPYGMMLLAGLNTGQAVAILITICQLTGLAGLYVFFRKIGFSTLISSISLVFIVCQQAFVVPYIFYNGGEILLFAFEGWFLYGCAALKKTDLKLVLFVLLAGWVGFFFKSSFLWIYAAGLCCLWTRLSMSLTGIWSWIKKGLWIAIPAIIAILCIHLFYLSKGQNPTSSAEGIKLTLQTFGFPLASPILSGFSADDLFHGLLYHTGTPLFNDFWSLVILAVLALLSIWLILSIAHKVPNKDYRLFIIVFYLFAILVFGSSYLRQLTISYEARHFRIIGLLIAPGLVYLATESKRIYKLVLALLIAFIGFISIGYLIKGYRFNKNKSARGITGIAQPNIDQPSLNQVMKLDRENKDAVFVFVSNDIGLEIQHNRIITLQPIGADLKINTDDYVYKGFAGPLYIVLPESYAGPKEKLIMKSFPGYAGFNLSMLSDNYVLYTAKMKRK